MFETKPKRDQQTYQMVAHLDNVLFELQRDLDRANAVIVDQAMTVDTLAKRLLEAQEEMAQLRLLLCAPRVVVAGGGNCDSVHSSLG